MEARYDWVGGDRAVAMESLAAAFERTRPETSLDERPAPDVGAAELAERPIANDERRGPSSHSSVGHRNASVRTCAASALGEAIGEQE